MAYQCQCDICGKEFMHQQPNALRCSQECRKKFRNRKNHRKQTEREKRLTAERNKLSQICQRCGCSYIRNRQTKYCSDDCLTKNMHLANNRHCKSCGVRAESIYQNCCKMCRETIGIVFVQNKKEQCNECKALFTVIGTRKKFCSKKCYIKFDKRSYPSKHRRRARKYGVEYDGSVNLNAALNRFGRICYLCNEFIMGGSSPTDPEQAVLEHIIPMAAGGTHTWDNVNVAHRRCNDMKLRTSDIKLILTHKDTQKNRVGRPESAK